MEFEKTLENLEKAVLKAGVSGQDISADYHGKEDFHGYKLQEELRIESRAVLALYDDEVDWGRKFSLEETRRILRALKKTRDLFSAHPFHHVIEGRIAQVVKISLEHELPVPPEYNDDFVYFDFQPWNHPGLNYNTPRDAIEQGHPDWAPPGWSVETA